jgi:hypothetical protein
MSLGNGAYLEEQDRQAALERKRRAAWNALSPEEQAAKLAADVVIKQAIKTGNAARLLMNSQAPLAKLPLASYQNKMRIAMMNADFEAFNKLLVISKFGWGANTPLGMYRFQVVGGKRIYKAFSDVDLANLFQYMSVATNTYGYNRFAEPGSSCDWNTLLTQYVNMQIAAKKKYPNTDWRHVVEIYPGRYICQVYKPSLWVKIRKPVVAAVAIVAAIYLGPIIMAKIGGEGAAAAAGTATGTGEAVTAGIVGAGTKAGAVTAVTTKATAVAITTTQATSAVSAIAAVAETGSLFSKVQTATTWVNRARSVDAIIKGELPPPPIGISGSNFTEWALDIAKDELIKEVQERTGEYLTDKAREKLIAAEESRLRAEIEAMQAELAALTKGLPIEPSKELDTDIRERIIAMQDIERKRADQNALLLAAGAGALLLMAG